MRIRNTAPTVKFRAEMPAWMEPRGAAFLEIDARPAGQINTAFMAAVDAAKSARAARDESPESQRAFAMDFIGAVYDTCVITWRTNLIDDETGQPLTCDRATFMEVADLRVSEISKAILDFQTAILEAGQRVIADNEAATKN
jgi:hypothetical protein